MTVETRPAVAEVVDERPVATDAPPPRTGGRVVLAVVLAVSSLIVLFAWAVSSPVGSSPDEDYHSASIWCGWGVSSSICGAAGTSDRRLLPEQVARRACYWNQPDASAACVTEVEGSRTMRPVSAANYALHLYPPVYYAVARVFVTHDVTLSTLLIRWFNGLLLVAVVGVVALLVPGGLRRTMLLAYLVTMVPLGVFVVASVNPSAWAVVSAGTFWVCLYALYGSAGRRRWLLAGMAVVCAALGCAARADVCAYTCVAVGVVAVLRWRRLGADWLPWATSAVVVGLALASFLTSRQVQVAATTGGPWRTGSWPRSTPVSTMVLGDLWNLPSLIAGVFGSWKLGWFDVAIPTTVFLFALGVFCAVAFSGLAQFTVPKVLALSVVGACLVVVPLAVLVPQFSTVGQAVQPRYLLPLVIVFAGLVVLPAGREMRFSTVQANGLAVVLSIAHAIALHATLRRYVSGSTVSAFDLDVQRDWWWHTSVSPMLVWGVASVAFFVASLAIFRMFVDDRSAQPADRIDDLV